MTKAKPTVLLIEDDIADQEILKRAIAKGVMRADLRVVSDGDEALEYLGREGKFSSEEDAPSPDLILLDINMPKMNGLETLSQIRKLRQSHSTPVVMLTTSDNKSDILASYELGANSYITKPLNFEAFLDVIKELDQYWFDYVVLPPTSQAA